MVLGGAVLRDETAGPEIEIIQTAAKFERGDKIHGRDARSQINGLVVGQKHYCLLVKNVRTILSAGEERAENCEEIS